MSHSQADIQDAVVALVHRAHAEVAFHHAGAAITSELYHFLKKQLQEQMGVLRGYRYIENFDISVTPYPGDPNDILTTVALRMFGRVFTANLRLSHGIWLYKVWNTPLPDLHVTERVNSYARNIVDAAIESTKPQWSGDAGIDLNDPESLKAHGITDLSQ
jgi:hypothetical protein